MPDTHFQPPGTESLPGALSALASTELPEIQCTGTELLQALTEIRDRRDMERAEAAELEWEHGTRLEDLTV